MKVSVIMWDCGFRERFHAVESYLNQSLPRDEYEVLWVEFYDKVRGEITRYDEMHSNFTVLCLHRTGPWQYGVCVNEGVRVAKGSVLVISDGDVVVDSQFLEDELHVRSKVGLHHLVNYHRRYDEVDEPSTYESDVEVMRDRCVLTNPCNYAGCFSIEPETFYMINGYEEDMLFSGPSACAKDAYVRLKNAGACIRWDPSRRLFHPWHRGTAPKFAYFISNQDRIIAKRDLHVETLPNIGIEHGKDRPPEDRDVVESVAVIPRCKELARACLSRLWR